ncbi:MAG: hypothetical protein MRY49_02260, partial [Candidatus Pacebacteria bacterium]|nr:hypothetical protein [Candidatus Paceibacterota bacterium]
MKEYSLTGKIVSLWLFILPFVFSNGIIYISDGPKYFYVTFGVAILSLYYAYLVFKGKGVYLGKWLSVILLLALVSVYMSALSGFSFSNSFWPGTLRMNGVYLFTHLFFLVFILSQLFQKKDWQLAFKNIAISSVVFAFFSYLAPEGFGLLKTT